MLKRKKRKQHIDIILVSTLLTLNKLHSSKFHFPCAHIHAHQNPNRNEFVTETLTKPAFTSSK